MQLLREYYEVTQMSKFHGAGALQAFVGRYLSTGTPPAWRLIVRKQAEHYARLRT